jgi:digeranylgeranylglycerophospholipid reductase
VPRLGPFVEKISAVFDLSHARVVARRGGLFPCGGPLRRFAARGVMLLGDAAGTVSPLTPLTGGGIHPALAPGREAGVAISDFLLDGGPEPAALIRRSMPGFLFKRWLRTAFDVAAPPNWVYDRLLSAPAFRQAAQTVFLHHRGLFSLLAWRDIVLALAR